MTTKQRAYLKSLAMTMDPIFQIGKSSTIDVPIPRQQAEQPWQSPHPAFTKSFSV